MNQTALLGGSDKPVRWNYPLLRVSPPHEGRYPEDLSLPQTDLGLIVQKELVLFDRPAQLRHQRKAAWTVLIVFGIKDDVTPPVLLCGIPRYIRPLKQSVGIFSMLRIQCDSDIGLHRNRQPFDQKWGCKTSSILWISFKMIQIHQHQRHRSSATAVDRDGFDQPGRKAVSVWKVG